MIDLDKLASEAARLTTLAAKATAAPWEDDEGSIEGVCEMIQHGNVNTISRTGEFYSHNDAAMIVASRNAAPLWSDVAALCDEVKRLRTAISTHHAQKSDDRCIEDDDRLYAAAGLPTCDRRVGDKAAMLRNCDRYVTQRCEGGGPWRTYAELEAENAELLKSALKADSEEIERQRLQINDFKSQLGYPPM